jgi:lipopolysaccharide export system protein LptA
VATGVALGTATITATYGGMSGTAALTIGPHVLDSVSVAPASTSILLGATQSFTATAHWSDGTADVTFDAGTAWSATAEATMAGNVATGVALGTATITAAQGGKQGTAILQVTAAALTSVTIAPADATIAKGRTLLLAATAHYADGSSVDVTASTLWASSDLLSVDVSNAAGSRGLATGIGVGSATVTASFSGMDGTTTLTVTAHELDSVSVAPLTATIAKGRTQPFTATAHWSDGPVDVTFDVATVWSATAEATMAGNVAAGVAEGMATITATYGGMSGTAALTVTPHVLDSVSVAPATATIAKGRSQAFTATAHWSDGTADVTFDAGTAWSATAEATMAGNVATGVAEGAATITATYGGMSGTAALTVTPHVLDSVSVAPASTSILLGATQSFTATAHWSDGPVDVTSDAGTAWSATAEATMAGNVATGVAEGTATITAAHGGTQGTAMLQVTAATLTSVTIAPADATIAKGRTLLLAATAHYSDGSSMDVTSASAWASSDLSVDVSNDPGTRGLATAIEVGSATLTATYSGVVGTTSLTVTAHALDSVSVAPGTATVAKGRSQPFTATAHWSDGTEDVTFDAGTIWSATAEATMAGNVATGVTEGAATVTASFGGKDGSAAVTVGPHVLDSVSVAPATATIAKGRTQPFTATAHWSDGTADVTFDAGTAWSATAEATMAGNVATGVAEGTATITASFGGMNGTAALIVGPHVLDSVTVAPLTATIQVAQTQPFTATAHWSDGPVDVTADAGTAWWADAHATLSGNVATGTDAGTAIVTAAYGGKEGTATLVVSAAMLTSVSLTPANATIALGYTQQYTATAVYSNGAREDVTALAAWDTGNHAVATVDALGLVTSAAAGSTDVHASFGGFTPTAPLTVTSATLVSVNVSPIAPTVVMGYPQQFVATGVFSDSTKQDLTTQVAWSSTDPGVATVAADGLATTLTVGTTTITATVSGKSGATTLSAVADTLDSVAIAPFQPTVMVGMQVQFTATAVFLSGATEDVTAAATWTSDAPALAVSDLAGSKGLATGNEVGTANVTATYAGLSAVTLATVNAATLDSITVTPNPALVLAGTTRQFSATGHYSNGAAVDLTGAVDWRTDLPSLASISNAAGSVGLLTAIAAGNVVVTASRDGVSGTASVQVSNSVLTSIAVTPANATLPAGYRLQFTAIGTYTDAGGATTTLDITRSVIWSSDNTAVATISNALGTEGLASGIVASATPVRITATLGAVSGLTNLTVNSERVRSIVVTPAPFTLSVGGTLQLHALGTFGTGAAAVVLDITAQCNWSTSDRKTARVSKAGIVTGVKAGLVTLTARESGKSATADGTVF